MKKIRLLPVLLLISIMTLMLAGCGGSGGIKKGEEFSLGEYTMKYESAESAGNMIYVTVLLREANAVPIGITGGGFGVLINMKLGSGADEEEPRMLSVNKAEDPDEYEKEIVYGFEVTDASEYHTATVFISDDENKCAVLDLDSAMSNRSAVSSILKYLICLVVLIAAGLALIAKKKKTAHVQQDAESASMLQAAQTPGDIDNDIPGPDQ